MNEGLKPFWGALLFSWLVSALGVAVALWLIQPSLTLPNALAMIALYGAIWAAVFFGVVWPLVLAICLLGTVFMNHSARMREELLWRRRAKHQ